jgi:hypothetical protein
MYPWNVFLVEELAQTFHKKGIIWVGRFITPSPPSYLGLQTIVHAA